MILLGIIPLLYLFWIIFILVNWIKLPSSQTGNGPGEAVSVIIPVRNEESTIGALLEDLNCQDFPLSKLTVWVVDDGSTDRTPGIVKTQIGKVEYSLNYLNGPDQDLHGSGGKKNMILLGNNESQDSIVLQTDGDCRIGPRWLKAMTDPFKNQSVRFVAGPVCYTEKRNFIHSMLQLELSSLLVTSAAMIGLDKPVMCNGACMAYRKEAFLNAGGFAGNENIASGDDSFLIYSIHKMYPGSVKFLKDKNAVVQTREPSDFNEFLQQRIRWAGKWKTGKNHRVKLLALFIYLTNFGILALAFFSVLNSDYRYLIILMSCKLLAEFLLLYSWSWYFRLKINAIAFIAAGILYPIYAIIFGVMANTSKFTWKGRNYMQPKNDRP